MAHSCKLRRKTSYTRSDLSIDSSFDSVLIRRGSAILTCSWMLNRQLGKWSFSSWEKKYLELKSSRRKLIDWLTQRATETILHCRQGQHRCFGKSLSRYFCSSMDTKIPMPSLFLELLRHSLDQTWRVIRYCTSRIMSGVSEHLVMLLGRVLKVIKYGQVSLFPQ